MLERAFALDKTDGRVLFELDQLYKKLNRPVERRLVFLNHYPQLVEARDDLFIEHCALLNLSGKFEQVQSRLGQREFHPWEGGEGKVTGAYVASLLGIARRCLEMSQFEQTLSVLNRARRYPPNLGEGKLPGALENDLDYFAGLAQLALGAKNDARKCFQRASIGIDEPVSAMFYNDQPPHMIFYQGLALRKLGRESEAVRRFNKLIEYGKSHLHDHVTIDYFAVSLPEFLVFEDDLDGRNAIHCRYMMALGLMGLGQFSAALDQLQQVSLMDVSHLGANVHMRMLDTLFWR
jgi:tetratricopeptide (TPR) repeat protein